MLPQASVAVHVLVITLLPTQGSLLDTASTYVIVTPEQLSVPVALPVVDGSVSAVQPNTSMSDGQVIIGAVLSVTVMI